MSLKQNVLVRLSLLGRYTKKIDTKHPSYCACEAFQRFLGSCVVNAPGTASLRCSSRSEPNVRSRQHRLDSSHSVMRGQSYRNATLDGQIRSCESQIEFGLGLALHNSFPTFARINTTPLPSGALRQTSILTSLISALLVLCDLPPAGSPPPELYSQHGELLPYRPYRHVAPPWLACSLWL